MYSLYLVDLINFSFCIIIMNSSKLKIYTFEGKHLGDVSNIYNSKWNGEINNKYLKTGIYIYIIENKKDEILKTGRLKYLNEK